MVKIRCSVIGAVLLSFAELRRSLVLHSLRVGATVLATDFSMHAFRFRLGFMLRFKRIQWTQDHRISFGPVVHDPGALLIPIGRSQGANLEMNDEPQRGKDHFFATTGKVLFKLIQAL
jgi:hypothetical protein